MNPKSILYDKSKIGYVFILPGICILTLFVMAPLVAAIVTSLFDYTILLDNFTFVGLDNFRAVLTDERFWKSSRNTFYFTAIVVPVQTTMGLLIALAVGRIGRGNSILRTVFFLPVVASMTVVAMMIAMMANYNFGIIPAALRDAGLPVIDVFNSTTWAMPAVILISIYKNFGFSMVIFVAAIHSVPRHLYEAAEMDGAGPLMRFRHVTLPGIAPAIVFTLITVTITSFQVFDQVYVTTGGGPLFTTETAVGYIYTRAFETNELSFANAHAVLLFLIILVTTLAVFRVGRRWEGQN